MKEDKKFQENEYIPFSFLPLLFIIQDHYTNELNRNKGGKIQHKSYFLKSTYIEENNSISVQIEEKKFKKVLFDILKSNNLKLNFQCKLLKSKKN